MTQEMPETTQAPPAAEPEGAARQSSFPTPRQLFILLAAYFAYQVIVRTWLSNTADSDEAEQCLLTQRLSWGYGPQPPLYTWLQFAFFAVLGHSIFALSLLKNLLLACTYLLTYYNGRLITGRTAGGMAAAISLLFLPAVVWESQRDLTHSVLASTLAAATLLCLLRARGGDTGWYGLLGLCAGLGVLSKYNYGFWLAGLLLAALSLREFRPLVLTWRMLLTLGIGAALALPNLLWIWSHRGLAFMDTSKFNLQASGRGLKVICTGVEEVMSSIALFLAPLALIWLAVLFRAPRVPASPPNRSYARLLLRALLFVVVLLVVVMACFGATSLRQRWFQPILICMPVLVVALAAQRLDLRRLRWLAATGLLVMLVIMVVIPARIVFAEALKREEPLTHPYAELAAQIRPVLPAATLVVGEDRVLVGNLRMQLPDKTCVIKELAELFPTRTQHCFLVWDATRSPLPPDSLLDWAKPMASSDLRQVSPQYFSATYKYHRAKQMRLGFVQAR